MESSTESLGAILVDCYRKATEAVRDSGRSTDKIRRGAVYSLRLHGKGLGAYADRWIAERTSLPMRESGFWVPAEESPVDRHPCETCGSPFRIAFHFSRKFRNCPICLTAYEDAVDCFLRFVSKEDKERW